MVFSGMAGKRKKEVYFSQELIECHQSSSEETYPNKALSLNNHYFRKVKG